MALLALSRRFDHDGAITLCSDQQRGGMGRLLRQKYPRRTQVQVRRAYENDDDFFHNPASFILDPITKGLNPNLGAIARGINPNLLPKNWHATPAANHIALDVVEKPDFFEVKGDLPGVKVGDVDLGVDGDVLSVSVKTDDKKHEIKEEGGVKIHRNERSSTFIRRAIRLPEGADTEHISADMSDGVLTVTIPKCVEAKRHRKIAIGKEAGSKAIADRSNGSRVAAEEATEKATAAAK